MLVSVTSNDDNHGESEENTYTIKMSDVNEKERRLTKLM